MAKQKQAASSSPKRAKTTRKRDSATTHVATVNAFEHVYALGPQDDGAIVLRIDSDFDLMILRKAIEKQQKNSTAAEGTIGALSEGTDPLLDQVQRSLARLHKTIAAARAPANQIADTPIGKAIASAGSDATATTALAAVLHPVNASVGLEQVDGEPDGIVWSPSVPRPRPKRGDVIAFTNNETRTVGSVVGWREDFGHFIVRDSENVERAVVSHLRDRDVIEWRTGDGSQGYQSRRVEPLQSLDGATLTVNGVDAGTVSDVAVQHESAASELLDATKDSDALVADAPQVTIDEYEIVETDAAGESRVASPPTSAKRATKQRDRNASHNGLKKPGGKRK